MFYLSCRSYEAEVAFLEEKKVDSTTKPEKMLSRLLRSLICRKNSDKAVCSMNCIICKEATAASAYADKGITNANVYSADSRWLRSKGRFISVGAAVISCRNEKAPDGMIADAHLADGFLHLILVRECPRPFYLW